MDENLLKAIKRKIWASDQILLTSHKRPDGDAVGSLLGLGILLQEMGKTVQMVLEDGVPGTFKHLEEVNKSSRKPVTAMISVLSWIVQIFSVLVRSWKTTVFPPSTLTTTSPT